MTQQHITSDYLFEIASNAVTEELFREFTQALCTLCSEERDCIVLFRTLRYTCIRLYALRKFLFIRIRYCYTVQVRFLDIAIGYLTTNLDLLNRYGRTQTIQSAQAEFTASPLHWKATPTELAELLCALDFSGAICDTIGEKVCFTDLVGSFERWFNIRLGEPYDLKRNVLRRKTRLTVFLDKLRGLLNEYSIRF